MLVCIEDRELFDHLVKKGKLEEPKPQNTFAKSSQESHIAINLINGILLELRSNSSHCGLKPDNLLD